MANETFALRINLGIIALLLGTTSPLLATGKETRTFEVQQVRYTLPGSRWEWTDMKQPGGVFAAISDDGYMISLAAFGPEQPQELDGRFIAEYEQMVFSDKKHRKRSSRMVTVNSLQAYQAEGIREDGRTTVNRAFFANGYCYYMVVIGGKKPIENDPKFEAILKGFEFTTPPDQLVPQHTNSAEDHFESMMYLLIGISVYIFYRVFRSKPRQKQGRHVPE